MIKLLPHTKDKKRGIPERPGLFFSISKFSFVATGARRFSDKYIFADLYIDGERFNYFLTDKELEELQGEMEDNES